MKCLLLCVSLLVLFGCTKEEVGSHGRQSERTTHQAQTIQPHDTQSALVDKNERYSGKVLAAFESFEFIYHGEVYYIIDNNSHVSDIITQKRADGQTFYVDKELCLLGKMMDKSDNKDKGFGHLSKYDKAILVEGLC